MKTKQRNSLEWRMNGQEISFLLTTLSRHSEQRGTSVIQNLLSKSLWVYVYEVASALVAIRFLVVLRLAGMTR